MFDETTLQLLIYFYKGSIKSRFLNVSSILAIFKYLYRGLRLANPYEDISNTGLFGLKRDAGLQPLDQRRHEIVR